MHHAVLAAVSNCYSPLQGRFLTRYSPVRHFPLNQLAEASVIRFSFDLHVLSTPPAFILSQDQTLNEWYPNELPRSNQIIEANLLLQNRIDENLHFTVLPVSMKDSLSFWCFVFLLHCLIYKVQTAHSRRSFILTLRFEPVKHFFQLFFAVSLARVVPAFRVLSAVIQQPVSCELLYLSTPFRVCQELFSALSELSARFRSLFVPPVRRSVNIPNQRHFVNT